MNQDREAPSSLTGTIVRIAIFVAAVLVLNYVVGKLIANIEAEFWDRNADLAAAAVIASVALYVVLMALPFMPGIEVGVTVMVMLGVRGVVIVYVATLLSLTLSFCVGRLLPATALARFLAWLRLRRAQALVLTLAPLVPAERLDYLTGQVPSRLVPFATRHRYLLVALALNIPGNALIGGGGGIGMVAGMSRLYAFPGYFLLIAVATAPVPVALLSGFVAL